MEVGDATVLEYNKAQSSLLNTEKKLEQIRIARNAAMQQLAALNAGETISFNDSVFATNNIESDFVFPVSKENYNFKLDTQKTVLTIPFRSECRPRFLVAGFRCS